MLVQTGHTLPQLATMLDVSPPTVRRWLREANIAVPTTSLRDRPRGASAPVARPAAEQLRALYVGEELSLLAVGERLGVGTHLVRMWLREAGIGFRPPGGRRGSTRPSRPLKEVPPFEELHALRMQQRLLLPAIAARYGVHPQTVARWCRHHDLPARLPPAGDATDADLITMYQDDGCSGAEIARRTGVTAKRVLAVLHDAGIEIDPSRQAAAVGAAARRRAGETPSLAESDAEWAVARFGQGWAYSRIADGLGVSTARVRRELHRRGVPDRRRPFTGPSSRGSRTSVPVEQVHQLYVESEWAAEDVGARLQSPGWMVLRTAHAHGLPVRQGGYPAVSATVALIDALYSDDQVTHALTRHGITPQPAGGDIADRFPEPVPLTRDLLRDLYVDVGCSSGQIELLTGQSQAVIRNTIHRLGIPIREEHMSPALRRLREAARADFLAGVATAYGELGSSRLVGERYGCATVTAHRWLTLAGISLPGRGRWSRHRA